MFAGQMCSLVTGRAGPLRMARAAMHGAPCRHWCVGGLLGWSVSAQVGKGAARPQGGGRVLSSGLASWAWGSAGGPWVASSTGTPSLEAVSSSPGGGETVGLGACTPLPRGRGLKRQQEGRLRLRRPVCVGGASWLLAATSEQATWGPGLGGRSALRPELRTRSRAPLGPVHPRPPRLPGQHFRCSGRSFSELGLCLAR